MVSIPLAFHRRPEGARPGRAGRFGIGLLLLGGVLAQLALGCGDDKPTDPGDPPRIEVRNGTWRFQETLTFTGPDSCLARTPVDIDTTDVMCNVAIVEGGNSQFQVLCDINENGEAVDYTCRVRVNLGLCYQIVEIEGSGTVTDSTFDINSSFYTRLEPVNPGDQVNCALFYGSFIDACTTHVAAVGTFLSSDGDTICAADPAAPGLPLERLLAGAGARLAAR